MPTIGELIINLNANTASFVTELDRVKNLSFDTAKQVERSFSIIGTAALGMISVAAAAFAVGIDKTAEWEVKILHLAESAGTTTETMSGLSFAAKMMGLDIDTVAKAMERFDKQLLQAQLGNAKSAQNMSMLGIDPKLIKTSDDALMLLADHFAKLPDGAVKSGEAMMAFGKAGAAMIPLLNLGRQGIQDFMDQAKAMGVVISKEQAEAAEIFEQNITRMKESLHGLWVEITNATLPAMNDLAAKFQDTSKQKGFWHAVGEGTAALAGGTGSLIAYTAQGSILIALQEKMRPKIEAITAAAAENTRAFDALKKSTESIITSLRTQIATFGQSAMAVQEYKIRTDAAKIGQQAWAEAEIALYEKLQKKLTLTQQLALIENETKAAKKITDNAELLKIRQDELAALRSELDVMTRLSALPPSALLGPQGANERFTASISEQIDALKYAEATFGMTSDQIAIFNLRQLDGSVAAAAMIPALEAEQAKMQALRDAADAMQRSARANAAAWREFGQVAERSLNDLIFSGKKFSDVLRDIAKSLGEMFLKWALFGPGGSGGLFGSLFNSIFGGLFGGGIPSLDLGGLGDLGMVSPLPSFAGGGSVSAGVPVMVGENGPEVFMPSTAGAIIPNGGGAGPQVNIVNNIDARGSSITEEQFRRSLAASESRAVQRALLTSREAQLRSA